MHRIPHGRVRHNQPGRRPAVLLMHGLLSSSADWVVLGPGRALAYLLAEEGYDVWMGNARGNYYSRQHQRGSMDPDRSTSFWRFSWEEIGLYDLSAFVDLMLATTGETQVDYVGHSQGGTTFLVLNSLKPEYNAKFRSFQGLAPASYFENNKNELYNRLATYEKLIETVALTLGIGEILTKEQAKSLIASRVCDGADLFDPVCVETIQNNSASVANKNESLIPLFLSHAPAGASIRQIAHYGQVIRRGVFARFYHNVAQNLLTYGRLTPPEYQVSRVVAPTFLYYGLCDVEVNYKDLLLLSQRMGNVVEVVKMDRPEFNHFDFIWGNTVKVELYDKLIANMKMML